MCRSVGWLTLERPIQNSRLQPRGQLARALPGMATEQPRQPLLPKPLAPAGDKRIVKAQLVADLCPGMARRQQQDQPRSPPIVRPTAPSRCPLTQFPTFPFRQSDRAHHEHDYTTFLPVTYHQCSVLRCELDGAAPLLNLNGLGIERLRHFWFSRPDAD